MIVLSINEVLNCQAMCEREKCCLVKSMGAFLGLGSIAAECLTFSPFWDEQPLVMEGEILDLESRWVKGKMNK